MKSKNKTRGPLTPKQWGRIDYDFEIPIQKATAAGKLLCAVGDWKEYMGPSQLLMHYPGAVKKLLKLGYKDFNLSIDGGRVHLTLGATTADTVEIQTIIAYPYRNGHGSAVMARLCELADTLGVHLWLQATPFGIRTHIPELKLKVFYENFGFVEAEIDPTWFNEGHRRDRSLKHPMTRDPSNVTEGTMRCPMEAASSPP
jgi:hypothetical protein